MFFYGGLLSIVLLNEKEFIMAKKQVNQEAKPVVLTDSQFVEIGISTAERMAEVDNTSSLTKRGIVLEVAQKYAGDVAAVSGILSGIAKYHTDKGHTDGTVAKAKSEVKAVFDAIAKTGVSEINLKILTEFKGEFNSWIDEARRLRNIVPEGQEVPESNRKSRTPKMTVKQESNIVELFKKATPVQLAELSETAIETMHKNFAGAKAGEQTMLVIHAHANALCKDLKAEVFLRNVAEQIRSLAANAISHFEAQKAVEIVEKVPLEDEVELQAALA
jgi:hypothetical protein